jgi:hypothetical protein
VDAEDFREMALSLDGAEEGSHLGAPDFRVGGRIFALTRNNAGQARAFPSRPKQRAGQNHERLVEEARDNGGGFASGGGLLQFFRQDRPGLVENTN